MAAAQPPGNPRTLSDEFAIRYYRWSLDDARRELRENFPLLRAVKSSLVIRAIAYLESLADRDRLCGATTLVKRSHRRAVELAGDSWGAEDEAIDRDYRNAGRIPRPDEEWSRPARLDEADKLKLDRGQFLSAVKAEPTPVSLSRRSTSGDTRRRSGRGLSKPSSTSAPPLTSSRTATRSVRQRRDR
jgi:hypothetical protein